MDLKCMKRYTILILVMSLAFIIASCSLDGADIFADRGPNSLSYRLFSWESKADTNNGDHYKPGAFPVDPLFEEFYLALGGEEILGQAISPSRSDGLQTRQYTESSLMVYDPQAPMSTRFHLAPLGVTLGVSEGDLLGKPYRDGRIINGHLVISKFLDVYEDLGGARFVGRPISEAYYNPDKQRVEQYFENLGFYQLEGQSKIYMMPYGAYACNRNCREQAPVAGIPSRQAILPDAFLKKTLELGLEFVGKPLTGLHIAADGKQEVIFENLVLVSDPEVGDQVMVKAIAGGISQQAASPAKPDKSGLSVFYEMEDGLGYNVPLYFLDFLAEFGGMQVAGQPISEVFSPEPGLYWQCFTNLCLQFNLNAEGEDRLKPVPLGRDYKYEQYDRVRDFDASLSLEKIDLKVWEANTYVPSSGSQQINTAIFEDGKPLKNFEPLLIATMPDGSQRKAYFQPSDENGLSSLMLAPIDAPNGTLIAYQVCLFGIDGEQVCVGDNYLIWDAE
jgi:hypothetical protein